MKSKTATSKKSLVFGSRTKTVTRSAIDSLFLNKEDNLWPNEVLENFSVAKEITTRTKLVELWNVLCRTQSNDFFEAFCFGQIEEKSLVAFYTLLGQELTRVEMQRIILYLPFECLPHRSWETTSTKLSEAIQHFIENYRNAWYQVVTEWDFRADFIDGDIPTLSEHPVDEKKLVCKAAHLIPLLVEKGIFSVEEVCSIAESSDDSVLKQSIRETFPTLYEMGFLSEYEVQKLKVDFSQSKTFAMQLEEDFTKRKDWLEELVTRVEITQEKVLNELVHQKDIMRPERLTWKKGDSRIKVLEQYGHELAKLLSTESDVAVEGEPLLSMNNQDILLVVILAVRELVETAEQNSTSKALRIKNLWRDTLLFLYSNGEQEVRDTIESTWSRWSFLNLVPFCEKCKLPFSIQTGEQAFEMICKMKQARDAQAVYEKIQSNTEIVKFVYPVVLVYGSLVKGYGNEIADLDLAVFVRPEVPIERRGHIQKLLRETISSKYVKGPPIEFWLSESGDNLTIRDFETIDASLGDSSLIHVLWNGIWFGDRSTVELFHKQLLTNYLSLSKKEKLTKELERGLLQYRLMHKGYDRLYPKGRSFQTKFGHDLGIESRFWDAGYRKLATKIFLRNVFVPSISK